jgi:hypothetical protein
MLASLGAARAQPAPGGALDLDMRLDFIERRLDAQRLHAEAWQYGWMSADAIGLGLGSYRAATENKAGHRAVGAVDATKSILDLLVQHFRPLAGLRGADPIRAMPADTPEQRQAQLAAAERLLNADAARASERWSVLGHLGNLAMNLAGGAVILGTGDSRDALIDAGVGILAGELEIFTAPWEPLRSLADYHSRFGGLAAAMELRPRPGGLELTFRF